jgi:hypothetical protein
MWIMIVMSSYFGKFAYKATTATPIEMTYIEFTSRERCIAAATFTKKQPKVYNAFCVQK